MLETNQNATQVRDEMGGDAERDRANRAVGERFVHCNHKVQEDIGVSTLECWHLVACNEKREKKRAEAPGEKSVLRWEEME